MLKDPYAPVGAILVRLLACDKLFWVPEASVLGMCVRVSCQQYVFIMVISVSPCLSLLCCIVATLAQDTRSFTRIARGDAP
jgi:hypothetical protein